MEDGYQSFVNIAKSVSDDCMELPREKDGTVLLSTVQAQFPTAIGLKYKSSSGGWRGIRAENNVLDPPYGGWGEGMYIITESDALKRKSIEEGSGHERKSKRPSKLLDDLIVLGLPFQTTEEELNTFITDSCGELAFCELKRDHQTKKSRGFGFIRFKTEEAAQEALKGHHEINGRKLEIRLSRKKDEIPMKLFVGRLAQGTTQEDVNDYFLEFGDLNDIFVPTNPFRGFGFITYSSMDDAMKVLRMNHTLQGAHLNVTAAKPQEDKGPGRQDFGATNYGNSPNNYGNGPKNYPSTNVSGPKNYPNTNVSNYGNENPNRNPSFGQNTGGYGDSRNFQQQQQQKQQPAIPQKDVTSELKDMLLSLINNQK